MSVTTRWKPTETVQIVRSLIELAEHHAERLADRNMGEEFLRATRESASAAEAASSGQPVRLGVQKGTTEALGVMLERSGRRVVAVREALMRTLPGRKDLHKSFGVGGVDASKSIENTLAGIDAILESSAAYPAETATIGLLERDIAALRELRTAVLSADATQEGAKGSKKTGTTIRDGIVNDVIRRIDRILAAASLEFADEPEILATFYAPLPTKKKPKK